MWMVEPRKAMSDIIRNYVGAQGTPEEKEGCKQMNLLEFEQLMTGANMPRCLQRGALFDYIV